MAFLKHLLPAWKRGIEDKRSANAAILSALNEELSAAEQEAMKSKVLMSLDTSTGEWLDAYGRLFGVLRRDEEIDDDYRQRIVGYILLRRGTIPSIIEAIQNFLQDEEAHVEIYEPYNNIFYLNRSRLNGPDHLLGEYYTFAVIDIKISKPFSEAVRDVINEFKPAGVTVRLTYQPSTARDVVELPLSSSVLEKTSYTAYIMNGMNDSINGHLNLTEGARDSTSSFFVTNDSNLNSDDKLTGSFAMSNPSYSLASFTTSDLSFNNETTVGEVATASENLSSDFYTKTGTENGVYALHRLNGADTSSIHFTMDLHSYLSQNYSTYLRKVQPDGIYTKDTYLSLVESPVLQYSIKATVPSSAPSVYSLQLLDLTDNEWKDIDSSEVHYDLKRGVKQVESFGKYLSDTGIVFARLKVDPNNKFVTVGPQGPVPRDYDLHVHFFELGFTKEIGFKPTIVPFIGEVTAQALWYADGLSFDGGSFTDQTPTKTVDGGTF